jgi:single-strand DNA-binding protein
MHIGMSEGINQVMLMGNLGADPELKQTSVGSVLKFNLATTRYWIDKNTNMKKEETDWHRVTIFGRRGEALQKFLTKGSRVFVIGRIHNSSYEKDGQKRYSTEIICDDLRFAGGGDRASSADPMAAVPPPSAGNGGYGHRPSQSSFDQLPF